MINAISVLETVQDNGADVSVDSFGQLNMTGLPSVTAINVSSIQKLAARSEQTTKSLLTFSAVASTQYSFVLDGFSMATGIPKQVPINYTSAASTSTAIISADITALIESITDFNVDATDNGSGVVALAGKASTPTCFNAPTFAIRESDSNISVTAPLTVSFAAAPTGGRTAQGICVVSNAGALSSVIITDGGEGYVTAPAATFSGGAGSSAAATIILFEGSVVASTITNAGSGYTCRQGWVAQGNQAAIYNKYQYNQPNATGGTGQTYPVLSNVSASLSYDEWIISVNDFPIGGNTTVSSPTVTAQFSILVNTAATNVNTLNSFWGSIANLQKGYKSIINDGTNAAIANDALTTGVITFSTTSALLYGIMPNDIVVIGTGAVPSTTGGAVVRMQVITSATAGVFVAGTGLNTVTANAISATTYKHVKRRPIAL